MGFGVTLPLSGIPLGDQREALDRLTLAGYTDVWASEVDGFDAFTPLASAVTSHPHFRAGTGIIPAFTRTPALLAMSAAALAEAALQPVLIGIGASSDVIVERWNGMPFRDPYGRVRDTVTFLDQALRGDTIHMESPSFSIQGFRLSRVPERRPKLLIAGLRPGMLRMAGRLSDGAVLNWLSASDVAKVVPYVEEGRSSPPEIVARLFVICTTDVETVRVRAKRSIAAYLNVSVYAKFHEWLGRGPMLGPMWKAWQSGDRKAALEAIPDDLVDELYIFGDPATCRQRIADYVANGVTTPVLDVTNLDGSQIDALVALGPNASNEGA